MKKLLLALLCSLSLLSPSVSYTLADQATQVQQSQQAGWYPRNWIYQIQMFKNETLKGTCSAVVIADGLALSAAHCNPIGINKLLVDGKPAEVLKTDKSVDLILLKVEITCSPNCPPIAKSNPALDTPIVTIGYPLGFKRIPTEGLVAAYLAPEEPHYMLITSPVIYGNSGGGVFRLETSTTNGVAHKWILVGISSQVAAVNGVPITHLAAATHAEAIQEFLKNNGIGV